MAVSLYVRGQFELIGAALVTDNNSFKKHLKRRNTNFIMGLVICFCFFVFAFVQRSMRYYNETAELLLECNVFFAFFICHCLRLCLFALFCICVCFCLCLCSGPCNTKMKLKGCYLNAIIFLFFFACSCVCLCLCSGQCNTMICASDTCTSFSNIPFKFDAQYSQFNSVCNTAH